MRALTLSAHGSLDHLQVRDDLPVPEVSAPSDVRIRMKAAALNHLDVFVVDGLPGITNTPPWIMGADGTGVIDQVGRDVQSVKTGDTVIINPGLSCRTCEYCREGDHPLCVRYGILGEHFPGTIAEYVVVPAANVRKIPESIPVPEAAAFSLATLTAWRMVVSRAVVRPGETVLIWGIGGGVALAAMQIAKLRGAQVWVTSGSEEKLQRAKELGADEVFDHRKPDIAKAIRARTNKRGFDVVIDNVGEATWPGSLLALGKRGRIVTCGGTSGPMLTTDVRRLFWNQWTIMGSTMGSDVEYDEIVSEFRQGQLMPPIDQVFPLSEGRLAFERMKTGRQFGKIVIDIGGR